MNLKDFPLQIQQVTQVLTTLLTDVIEGIYLYGSSIDGGLQPQSDLDFFVVVHTSLSEEQKSLLIQALLQLSGAIGNTVGLRYLEVTIMHQEEFTALTFPLQREFQYGEWLRDAFLKGYIPGKTPDQDLTILLRKVKQNSLVLYGKTAREVLPTISDEAFRQAIKASLPQLIQEIEEDQTNVILTLCRMLYSIQTGKITSKDRAVDYAIPYLPPSFYGLVLEAKDHYLGKSTLTPNRDKKELQAFASTLSTWIELA